MKKTFFICIAVIIGITTYAQDTTNISFIARPNTNTYIWSIAPQFTAEHAMRIDLEKRLKNGSSIILAPRFYVKSGDSEEGTNNGKMLGLGGEVFHKIRISDLSYPRIYYLRYVI
jgi:hypothetical protein